MKHLMVAIVFSSHFCFAFNARHIEKSASEQNIPQHIVKNLIEYFNNNSSRIKNKNYVTFVDFRRPSSEERMFVIETSTGQIEKFLVAHGKNSGNLFAEKFSNSENSKMSSLGYYLVQEKYHGDNGTSLKLEGLSATNSKAKRREIVMHYADYVSDKWVAEQGRIGRSWGCFTMNKDDFLKNAIDKIKDNSLMIAFN